MSNTNLDVAKFPAEPYVIKNWLGHDAATLRVYKASQGDEWSVETVAIQSSNTELSYRLHLTKQQALDLASALVDFACPYGARAGGEARDSEEMMANDSLMNQLLEGGAA